MILRRLGNKTKLAATIQTYFPQHSLYVEPFFGAGGMFFNKAKAQYNAVNDLDSDVFNLYQVIVNNKAELEREFSLMPIHSDLLEYWKENKEDEPIRKALRFLFMSNLTFMGGGKTLRLGTRNDKYKVYELLDRTFDLIKDVQFANLDFRQFIKAVEYRNPKNCFIYCDPPYMETGDNYSHSFTEADSIDLFDALQETDCHFAISEFAHPFIIAEAERRRLNIISIGERQSLANRNEEILITNFKPKQTLTLF